MDFELCLLVLMWIAIVINMTHLILRKGIQSGKIKPEEGDWNFIKGICIGFGIALVSFICYMEYVEFTFKTIEKKPLL